MIRETTALILIDIQNDYFPGGLMPLDDMDRAAANAAKVLADARAHGLKIFHIRHVALSDTAPFFRPGKAGSEIHVSVRPGADEPVILKNRPNSFVGTNLETALHDAKVTDLYLCGAMSQMCVDATARAAVDLGFGVTVVEDACAAARVSFGGIVVPHAHVHAAIMAPLAASYGRVVTTHDLLKDTSGKSMLNAQETGCAKPDVSSDYQKASRSS